MSFTAVEDRHTPPCNAERQWHKRQAGAGLAALDWLGKNPGESIGAIPPDIRDWLAPDQWRGLEAFYIGGRLATDGNQEAIRRQMIRAGLEVVPETIGRHRVLRLRARPT